MNIQELRWIQGASAPVGTTHWRMYMLAHDEYSSRGSVWQEMFTVTSPCVHIISQYY